MILDAGDILNTIGAVIFMLGGASMLIFTLRHSLRKADQNSGAAREAREADFWNHMQNAVDSVSKLAHEIDTSSEEHAQRLTRLTEEAATKIERLEEVLTKAKAALKNDPAAPKEREPGRVVDFKSASEALVGRTHRKVYEAFDRGMSIQEISRDTGLQLGEIELILTLRDKTDDKTSAG